ncbi:hypothetical protein AB0F81_36445 [Actinoplanes sp. NPDC024001]|uniref:hypothetical protein n=1 Tax=Actinoplanes sp. NPDC024001 TaxID=3154598 RepID=UPI0034020B89
MAERITDRLTVVDTDNREVLLFDADFAALDLGATGNEGDLRIRGDDGGFKFHLDGGRMLLVVRDAAGRDVLQFHAPNSQLRVGSQGNAGDVFVIDGSGATSIHLNGAAGDIVLQNADCAEEFECATDETPEPGSVVVLDADGGVRLSCEPYDTRVAGVVSGAGGYRPALVLDRRPGGRPRVPVAMLGKVFCRVDATDRPVRAGDLLTTAATPGHAMPAADLARATGAVIGKALRPLPDGTGLLPVLVCLR